MPTRTEGLTILDGSHPSIRALKRAGHVAEIHGNKLWNSSFLVMEHLRRNPLPKGSRVLEIGCGWGLLGIWCAKRFDARVSAIDADANVLPYLQLHAELNDVEVSAERKTFEQLTTRYLADFDVILGGDICFWDEMTRQLYNLIRRAQRAGVEAVMIADPCRPPFTDLAERCEANMDGAHRVDVRVTRPRRATGQILIVR